MGLRQVLDKYKVHFDKGGKYEKFRPAFAGIETFLYVPNHTTKRGAHIRDVIDLKRLMIIVVFALIPATLFGIWNIGKQHFGQIDGSDMSFMNLFLYGSMKFLPMVIVSYAVGLGIEFYYAIKRGHEVNEGYLVSGILIPLIMPVDLPLWMLAISVVFAVIIGKEVFGGTGMNIMNPALLARAFAFFSYPSFMSGTKIWVADGLTNDAISGETILGKLADGKAIDTVYSTYDMFMGWIPGSIGETSVLMIAIGALMLLISGVASWRVMFSAILGGAVMGLIFNAFAVDGNQLMTMPWYQHLLIGGFAFGIVFMATDPVSAAQTKKGKWIYGFLIGIFAIMIRVFNSAYPEGVMLAILLLNVFAPTIDYFVVQSNINARKKRWENAKKA